MGRQTFINCVGAWFVWSGVVAIVGDVVFPRRLRAVAWASAILAGLSFGSVAMGGEFNLVVDEDAGVRNVGESVWSSRELQWPVAFPPAVELLSDSWISSHSLAWVPAGFDSASITARHLEREAAGGGFEALFSYQSQQVSFSEWVPVVSIAAVPEPATFAVAGSALAVILVCRPRKGW